MPFEHLKPEMLASIFGQTRQIIASENIIACDTRGVNTPLTKSNNHRRKMRPYRTNNGA